ncbi:MAG TPA: hypothetical protein VIT92_13770, partial [Burkholderiaceae bacterium]
MQQTIAAVFNDRTAAQQAREGLLGAGFTADSIRLSDNENIQTDREQDADTSLLTGIRDLFSNLFGGNDSRTHLYASAVERGHCVLTITTSEARIDRAAAVLDRYNPLEIDDEASQWRGVAVGGP